MSIIGHLDMDAFFASVEEKDKPWLSGLPIVVGADPMGGGGRGVVSTASYAARRYGIHSAMPIRKAWELSEEARRRGDRAVAFLSVRFRRYQEISDMVMKILRTFSDRLEVTGVDEAYFDLSPQKTFVRAEKIARTIKGEIKRQTGLTTSIGIGSNKLIAKIASDFQKPDGLTVVKEADIEGFLDPLPVRKIPGIGPKTEALLAAMGVETIRDLKKYSWEELSLRFGSWGFSLYERARGIASSELIEAAEHDAKSIGEHETFMEDSEDFDFVVERLSSITEDIVRRMMRRGFSGFRTVVLIVRFSDFETKTRSVTARTVLKSKKELDSRALKLLLPFFEKKGNPRRKSIRMIGLRIEKLARE